MSQRYSLGSIPALALAMSLGLMVIAISFSSLRLSGPLPDPIAHVLFWTGLLVISVPPLYRLLGRSASRFERIGLVVAMGEVFYAVKVLRDPIAFTRYDELLHWRTALDIAAEGRLFHPNSLLVVSPVFPGLESNTVAVMQLSGANVFIAGLLVIAVARAALTLGLFLLYEEASGSPWLAGLASGIYMTGPSYIFFSSTFVYESMGLALAIGAILLTIRFQRAGGRALPRYAIALMIVTATLVMTHHVTTLATIGILGLLSVATYFVDGRGPTWRRAAVATFLCSGMMLIWLVTVAPATFAYLGPPILDALRQLIGLIMGDDVLRPLFTAETGALEPFWDRFLALTATTITVVGVVMGTILVWRRYRTTFVAVVLGMLALAYPAILVVRATRAGGELGARSSSFVFLGVAFAMAIALGWLLSLERLRITRILRRLGIAVITGTLLLGGVAIGSPSWQRLPGPFLVGADSRSISAEGLAVADWANEYLGPDHRFVADRTNRLLLGSYGHQIVVFAHGAGTAEWPVFVTDAVRGPERTILSRGGVEYLVIDRRLSASLPFTGYYYEKAEILRRDPMQPMRADQLDNYDEVAMAGRIYDSGVVQVYDVRRLR